MYNNKQILEMQDIPSPAKIKSENFQYELNYKNPDIDNNQQKDMSAQKDSQHLPFFSRMGNIFFCNGVTALLGWNAVLGSLDYFNYVYKGYNIFLYFPVPVFIAYGLTAVFFQLISVKFGYKSLTKIGIIGVNISMLLLLLFSIIFKDNIDLGFWLSIVVCFSIGFFNNFCQLSFFAMINYFGMQVVSRFTIGTAASGLSTALLRIIVTAIFGVDQSNVTPIIIYFTIAILFNGFDLVLNLNMFKSDEYIQKFQKAQSTITQQDQGQSQSFKMYIKKLITSLKQTIPYPLLIFFSFVITFLLFPGLSFIIKTDLGTVWTPIMMNLMFNIGDFGGKLLCDFRWVFNTRSVIYVFCCRLFFFYTIPLMDKQFTQSDVLLNNNVFPFFNMILFALSSGIVINGCFILAFQTSSGPYRKYAGVLCGILLQLGITVGTFLAIPFDKIVNPDLQ